MLAWCQQHTSSREVESVPLRARSKAAQSPVRGQTELATKHYRLSGGFRKGLEIEVKLRPRTMVYQSRRILSDYSKCTKPLGLQQQAAEQAAAQLS